MPKSTLTSTENGADSMAAINANFTELYDKDAVHDSMLTPASASTAAAVVLREDTDNGTNKVTLIAPASVASDKTLTLPDATDTLVGKDTTDTLTNKTFTAPVWDGWSTPTGTWSASDANTISIASTDLTSVLQLGDKIKVTNNSAVKYFYISTAPAFSTNTTFDVSGEVDLVAGAITLPYYSKMDSPQGFKDGRIYYKASANGVTTLPENTVTKLVNSSEIFDPNSNFDAVTNYRYTAPITGYYNFISSVEAADAQQAMVALGLYLYKNGVSYASSSMVPSAAYSGNTYHIDLNRLLYLVKGDYLESYAYVDTTDNGGPNAGTGSRFDIQFISI